MALSLRVNEVVGITKYARSSERSTPHNGLSIGRSVGRIGERRKTYINRFIVFYMECVLYCMGQLDMVPIGIYSADDYFIIELIV